jgi:hypothetical protein
VFVYECALFSTGKPSAENINPAITIVYNQLIIALLSVYKCWNDFLFLNTKHHKFEVYDNFFEYLLFFCRILR